MPDVLYVGLQDDEKILSFGIDAGAGKLMPGAATPAAGAPSVFAVSPDRRVLYIGYRGTPAIESCRIDAASGALTSLGLVSTEHPPTYLATDRTGKYLLSARHPVRRGNDALAARRRDRAQYLFADPSDAVGPVPLCRQPRPQQHRRVRRRPGDRAPDARRACADRGGPHRVRSRFEGDVPVRRGNGVRTSRLVPGRR